MCNNGLSCLHLLLSNRTPESSGEGDKHGYRLISEKFLHTFEDRILGRVYDKEVEFQTIGWEREISAPYGWSLEGISSKAGKA